MTNHPGKFFLQFFAAIALAWAITYSAGQLLLLLLR